MALNKVEEYISVNRALAAKYKELRSGKIKMQQTMSEKFKPIVDPLKELSLKLDPNIGYSGSNSTVLETPVKREISSDEEECYEEYDTKTPLIKPFCRELLKDDKYGLRFSDKGYTMGNQAVIITGNNELLFPGWKTFKVTPGLQALITSQSPNPESYTMDDYENYSEIVEYTNVYKRGNNPESNYLKANKGYKYRRIIKNIISDRNLSLPRKNIHSTQGSGLRKFATKNSIEYKYWNSLDELLDRLYILYGEVKSGNTNPVLINEIVNIIQEFREL